MKKFVVYLVTTILTITIAITNVSSEEIIRYTTSHEMYVQDASFVPSNEELREWFNIDLPIDENGTSLYTLEFNIEDINFTEPGEYDVVLTFYKRADQKFQKTFKLFIKEYVEIDDRVIGDIEIAYLKKIGTVVGLGIGWYLIVLFLLRYTSKKRVYIIVKDNKVFKKIKTRKDLDLDYILKKLKMESVSSCVVINKTDSPKYLEDMIGKKKYDYIVEVKS